MFGIREHHRIILKKMIVNIYEYLKKINIFHHRLNNITKHILNYIKLVYFPILTLPSNKIGSCNLYCNTRGSTNSSGRPLTRRFPRPRLQ